ncbi:MAG: hypothetical protein HZT40_14060 [Candidatus Thiothrix singaporensis]|uniref:Uncharacterized protein n=1 Tax=Candidatus Thiothrix singaporensis TaxID=2799669 RepID=A0A7L6ATT7_9GAMM|nr:MAG: hypothetical protein HZT40_14060 [Candidatus Thiothrix singaporensis]
MSLKIIGLLGVLLLNHRRAHITEQDVILMLEQVKAMGFRVSGRLENDFMTRLHNPSSHWHSPIPSSRITLPDYQWQKEPDLCA